MDCITTANFLVIVNRVPKGRIVPSRGLRQGYSLSPYLFLLCAKGLSALINQAEADGTIMGFACRRTCPKVSYLFFADDSLLFCPARKEECRLIKTLFSVYEQASSQVVNKAKSSIMFNPHVKPDLRADLQQELGVDGSGGHEKYLGLPSLIGKKQEGRL